MKPSEIDSLGDAACSFVMRGAADYLRVHNLTCDPEALAECCRSWAKIKLPEALADAKEAFECGMTQVGVTTFALSMRQAGVEAAKECNSRLPRLTKENVDHAIGFLKNLDFRGLL